MGQSAVTRDQFIFQGTALHSGGTFAPTITPPANQVTRYTVTAYLSAASSGALAKSATLEAQASVENGSVGIRFNAALANSNNPINSNTTDVTGLVGFGVQAGDAASWNGIHTLVITVSSSVVFTVTNGSSTTDANVTVVVDSISVGST